jgi:hypothetical protein
VSIRGTQDVITRPDHRAGIRDTTMKDFLAVHTHDLLIAA